MITNTNHTPSRHLLLIPLILPLLSACGGDSGPDTYSCPAWKLNDSMTYTRTTHVSSWSIGDTTSTLSLTITDRTANSISLKSGNASRTLTIFDGRYMTDAASTVADVLGGRNNQFCPPPAEGDTYEDVSFIPGPVEGTGDYVVTSWTVTGISIEEISVTAGNYTARKISLETNDASTYPDATLTRYYVGGIGIVKQIEIIPDRNTTTTFELTGYSFTP